MECRFENSWFSSARKRELRVRASSRDTTGTITRRRRGQRKSGMCACHPHVYLRVHVFGVEQRMEEGLVHITYTYTLSSSHFGGIMAWLPEFTACSITGELSLSQCDTTYLRLPSSTGRETTVVSDRWQPRRDPRSNDTLPRCRVTV